MTCTVGNSVALRPERHLLEELGTGQDGHGVARVGARVLRPRRIGPGTYDLRAEGIAPGRVTSLRGWGNSGTTTAPARSAPKQSTAKAAVELDGPAATGRRRALQNAPLPDVLRSYRLSFRIFWEHLLGEAHRRGGSMPDALLGTASHIWELSDVYCSALTDSYRQTCAERTVETDRRRSALVSELIDGPSSDGDTAREVARMLDFPFQGSFLVVTAQGVTAGEPSLPGLDPRLHALGVRSAWRARSRVRRPASSPARRSAPSPPVASASAPCTSGSTRPAGRCATHRSRPRLGGVLSLPEDDRTTLLATARAGWS